MAILRGIIGSAPAAPHWQPSVQCPVEAGRGYAEMLVHGGRGEGRICVTQEGGSQERGKEERIGKERRGREGVQK